MSCVAVPKGAALSSKRYTKRKNIKSERSGIATSVATALRNQEFVNLEGSAEMQSQFSIGVNNVAEVAKCFDLKPYVDRMQTDMQSYQSWLRSFTDIGQESPHRIEKKVVGNRVKTVHINRPLVFKLLSVQDKKRLTKSDPYFSHSMNHLDRHQKQTYLWKDDSWADFSITKKYYLDAEQRSQRQRSVNTKDRGKAIYLVDNKPSWWEPSMSTEKQSEGLDNHLRPPTFVQLMRTFYHCRKTGEKVVLPESKPDKVEEQFDYVQVNEQEVAFKKWISEFKDWDNRHGSYFPCHSLKKSSVGPGYKSLLGKVVSDETIYNKLPHSRLDLIEEATYVSWLAAPKVMRFVHEQRCSYCYDPIAFASDLLEDLEAETNPVTEYSRWFYYWQGKNDDVRYQTWLAERDCHNRIKSPRLLKPFEQVSKGLTGYALRKAALVRKWWDGTIRYKYLRAYEKAIESINKLILPSAKQSEIINPSLESLPEPDKLSLECVSTDINFVLPGQIIPVSTPKPGPWRNRAQFPSNYVSIVSTGPHAPMTKMEYENITRIESTSVDVHCNEILHNKVLESLLGNALRREVNEMLKDCPPFVMNGQNILVPDTKSIHLDRLISAVSQYSCEKR